MPARFITLAVALLYIWAVPISAQQTDPHVLYEGNCASCHEAHAGDFVFAHTKLSEGTIIGMRSGRTVADFLEAGHGGLSSAEVELITDHFLIIQQSGRLFFNKCRICHENAKQVARSELQIRDGTLVGRYTGREMDEFLTNHGRLGSEEVPIMIDVLKRQLEGQ